MSVLQGRGNECAAVKVTASQNQKPHESDSSHANTVCAVSDLFYCQHLRRSEACMTDGDFLRLWHYDLLKNRRTVRTTF